MDFEYLLQLRNIELELVIKNIPKHARILELGSGAGWQAKKLASFGFEVHGIDVKGNDINYNYEKERIWDVTLYDGYTIPFPEKHFDVVYSSNVFEHIPHIEEFQREIHRVLKDDGFCIHILPSASWRFWSSVTYYAVRILNYVPFLKKESRQSTAEAQAVKKEPWHKKILPGRHGERGNVFSELFLFSIPAWKALFRRNHWKITRIEKNKLYYSGELLLGKRLSLKARTALSRVLGSTCNIFYLQKSAKGVG